MALGGMSFLWSGEVELLELKSNGESR